MKLPRAAAAAAPRAYRAQTAAKRSGASYSRSARVLSTSVCSSPSAASVANAACTMRHWFSNAEP